ncbi:MAG: macro domain-containing protein [Planctomycetota bacterium]
MKLPQLPPDPDRDNTKSHADHALNDPLTRIQVIVGDITDLPGELQVDAIVNAANSSLLGGGGVDGAIHRAAGPRLREHNQSLGGCPTGLAKRTPAFDLEQRGVQHIIHTVGPVWRDVKDTGVPGAPGDDTAKLGYTLEDNLLASCYTQVFALAVEHEAKHLAIPAISTGAYNFPKPRAARIAFGHAHGHLLRSEFPMHVTFVCFNDDDAVHYHQAIHTRGRWMVNRGRV